MERCFIGVLFFFVNYSYGREREGEGLFNGFFFFNGGCSCLLK